ncbi:unnamed protein product, partial [Prorocentrum cordatum]
AAAPAAPAAAETSEEAGGAAPAAAGRAAGAAPAAARRAAGAKEAAGRAAGAKAAAGGGGDKEKSDIDKKIVETKKVIALYNAALTNSRSVLTNIEKDPDWSWAKESNQKAPLIDAIALLEDKVYADCNVSKVLTTSLPKLRVVTNNDLRFAGFLEQACKLQQYMEKVNEETSCLLGFHEVKRKAAIAKTASGSDVAPKKKKARKQTGSG